MHSVQSRTSRGESMSAWPPVCRLPGSGLLYQSDCLLSQEEALACHQAYRSKILFVCLK